MTLVRLEQQDDDAALVFRLQHLISGAIRFARPTFAHLVKIDGWFGARWLRFAGTRDGQDLHPDDRLAVPPFADGRVVSETAYRRRGDELGRIPIARPLYGEARARSSRAVRALDEHLASCLFVWYSGNTVAQDRASLMVYDVTKGRDQRAWYAELQRRDGTWTITSTVGTSATELHELETAYRDRLARLVVASLDSPRKRDRRLWDEALDASSGPDVARAAALIEKCLAARPDDRFNRKLHAQNLIKRRLFAEAEAELRAIERVDKGDEWRALWLIDWAACCEGRGDRDGAEAAYRESATLTPEITAGWIYLGGCLARHGKLDEAEAIHRHATGLRGDPDEAYLNLGYVLRARDRLEEAAEALESALRLSPDYPEASQALADVRAAIELRQRLDRDAPG